MSMHMANLLLLTILETFLKILIDEEFCITEMK